MLKEHGIDYEEIVLGKDVTNRSWLPGQNGSQVLLMAN